MSWRVARCIATLQGELTLMYPMRSKLSDGTIGDADHQLRTSQHNPMPQPDGVGVVTAIDITRDDRHGPDLDALAEQLLDDHRAWYVVWNRRIRYRGGDWKPYSGLSNPHTAHLHLSVAQDKLHFDDDETWLVPGEDAAGDVDDVPYLEWPRESRDRLLDDITNYALPHLKVPVHLGEDEGLRAALFRLSRIEATLYDLKGLLNTILGELDLGATVEAFAQKVEDTGQ